MLRLEGQLRRLPDGRVTGWDMGAALALARALGIERAAAEFLPLLEPVVVSAINDQAERPDRTEP